MKEVFKLINYFSMVKKMKEVRSEIEKNENPCMTSDSRLQRCESEGTQRVEYGQQTLNNFCIKTTNYKKLLERS